MDKLYQQAPVHFSEGNIIIRNKKIPNIYEVQSGIFFLCNAHAIQIAQRFSFPRVGEGRDGD